MKTALQVTVVSGLFWTWMRFILRKNLRSKAVAAHTVSFIHSVLAVLCILLLKHRDESYLEMDFYRPSSEAEELMMSTSLGYFLYDTCFSRRGSWLQSFMLLHHLGSCLGLAEILRRGCGGGAVLLVALLMEGSNPLLHLRRILHSVGRDRNYFYTYLEYVYVLLFVALRFGVGGVVTRGILNGTIKCETVHFYIMVFFNALSVIFLSVIVQYILKKYINLTNKEPSIYTVTQHSSSPTVQPLSI